MRITSAGLVGIGTTSPGTELHISRATAGRVIARLADPDGRTTELRSPDNVGNTAGVGTTTNHPFVFFQNNTEAVRVDESKRLLVGTSTSRSVGAPSPYFGSIQVETTNLVPLTVVNNTNDPQPAYFLIGKSRGSIGGNTIVQNGDGIGYIGFAGADGTDLETRAASISCDVDGTPGANDMPGRLVFSTTADGASSPTERLRIGANGQCSFQNGSIFIGSTAIASGAGTNALKWNSSTGIVTYDTSSRLIKESIEDCPYGIDAIKLLQPRKYFRTDDQRDEIGFVADELVSVLPEFVPVGPKSVITKNEDDSEDIPLGVNYDKLTAVLTKALQEAIAKIEDLEVRLATLEAA
jgi:hypothetical protein